jgi:hypothetical protein
MSEKQMTLAYTLDEAEVTITVVRASAKIGIERYLLASKGVEENKEETSEALKILRMMLYPDLTVTTKEVTGMKYPLTFEEFIELPEDLINVWADAVYKCNPSWRLQLQEVADPLSGEKTKPSKKG